MHPSFYGYLSYFFGEVTWIRLICKEPKEKKKKDISIHEENLPTLISLSKDFYCRQVFKGSDRKKYSMNHSSVVDDFLHSGEGFLSVFILYHLGS